jgi:hypothetical protein
MITLERREAWERSLTGRKVRRVGKRGFTGWKYTARQPGPATMQQRSDAGR